MEASKPNSLAAPGELKFLIRVVISLMALLILTFLVYSPGISGSLLLDDYTNLSPLGDDGGVTSWSNFRQFVFGNPSGPSGRPVSMLTFLIDAQHWPPNVASFKYTNIMIHLLNGLMLYWFASELFKALGLTEQRGSLLALFVAALWLLHPLNGNTTLYIVQRMTQLMTLFGLSALLLYLKGRQLVYLEPKRGLFLLCLCLFPFGLLSVLSKENGALILLLIIILEGSIFRLEPRNTAFTLWFRIAVVVPMLGLALYLLLTFSDSVAVYEFKPFSLVERLLSECRILLIYLSKIFLPINAGVSLFHDDLQVSKSLLNPVSTLFSVLILAALAGVTWFFRRSQPVLFLGVGWFFAMHVLESTYMPLELYFEHRNYMSMIGPLIASVWYFNLRLNYETRMLSKRVGLILVAAMLTFMTWQTWQHSSLWGRPGYLLTYWAETQPESSRAQIVYADFLALNGYPEESQQSLYRAHELNPREITVLLHLWNRACENGLVPPYSLEEISNMDGLEYYRNDINFHLREIVQNLILGKCNFPSRDVVQRVFEIVGTLPLANYRRATYHVLFSDLYVHYRQLDPALIQLRNAFEQEPDPQILIRQAMLSASAGNNSDALLFLERARVANEERSVLLPSSEEEISRIEAGINNALLETR